MLLLTVFLLLKVMFLLLKVPCVFKISLSSSYNCLPDAAVESVLSAVSVIPGEEVYLS